VTRISYFFVKFGATIINMGYALVGFYIFYGQLLCEIANTRE